MSTVRRPKQLFDLPDELLSEILQHVSVPDKQQRVQQTCMRLRRLLKQPFVPRTWGMICVRMQRDHKLETVTQLKELLRWLVARQAGITKVRLFVEAGFRRSPGLDAQMVLCSLAGALAPEQTPLLMGLRDPQLDIDIWSLSAFTLNALASTLQAVSLRCRGFCPQHWAPLCSLRNLRVAILRLTQLAPPPAHQPPFSINSMQLTSLRCLQICKTNVDIAPLMAHASALTSLDTLFFTDCSLRTLPAGVLNLPQLRRLGISRSDLSQVPPLAPLSKLMELQLDDTPALTDLRAVLAGQQQLQRLILLGTTPLSEENLEAVQDLAGLKLLDVSNRSWALQNSAVLGHLVRLTHDRGCTLLT